MMSSIVRICHLSDTVARPPRFELLTPDSSSDGLAERSLDLFAARD
jgi:hypothetical protein